jgi:histidinol dehydrogenase
VRPVDRAGLYVPGGQGGETPLLSSLLMNAIPAQVAGVREIAVVSPPRRDGTLNLSILAAAAILGIDEIYLCGSAWSVAALAFGTRTIPAVDVIAGPGNIYVTTAKRLLMGRVGIDMIAGPSEILVLADHTADPGHIAADLLSQAEHDPQAAALLVTTDESLAERTAAAVRDQLARLPRTGIAEQALERFGAAIVVPDLATGVEVVNRVAPEHLELLVQDPWALLGSIRHAGAIFMGPHAPEPVGDYFAGPNHVLPTMGTARFSSALTVQTFVKRSSIIATSARFLEANGAKIARMARMEGLEAHARSVEVRLKGKG